MRRATMAAPDDEGLQILERRVPPPSGANDAIVLGCAIAAAVAGLGFAVTLLLGQPIALYGTLLALAFFLLAIAVRRWFVDHYPDVEAAEPRGTLTNPDDDETPWAAV